MAYAGVVILCTLVYYSQVSIGLHEMLGTFFIAKPLSTGIPSDLSAALISVSAASKVECAMHCALHPDSHWMYFFTDTWNCYCYSVAGIQSVTFIPTSSAFYLMEVVNTSCSFAADCRQAGFVYSEVPPLCFYPSLNEMRWELSRNTCKAMGGDLVVLDSLEKVNYMSIYLQAVSSIHHWHIGMMDKNKNKTWTWVNNHAVVPKNWTVFDSNTGTVPPQYCGGFLANNKILIDSKCNNTRRFICEKAIGVPLKPI